MAYLQSNKLLLLLLLLYLTVFWMYGWKGLLFKKKKNYYIVVDEFGIQIKATNKTDKRYN
jgi:hypothetical protein